MSVQVRPLADGDFFPWLALYEGYGDFTQSPVTDQVALQVWSWIIDPASELNGFVAVEDDGSLVGLTHYRRFVRPITADTAVFVDDLYVVESARTRGTGAALIDAVKSAAAARGAKTVRLAAAPDNQTAQKLYESVAQRSDVVTYDLAV